MLDFRDNIRSLATHPWGQLALTYANAKTPPYGDYGQWAIFAWAITGDQKYADVAASKLALKFSQTWPDPNDVRESFAETEMFARWLWPVLTDAQKAPIAALLDKVCHFCIASGTPQYVGGWRYADSDQTTGQYLGLLLHDQTFGTSYATTTGAIGARQAISEFIAKAAGGEWIESSMYNMGTLKLVLLGCYAAGIELFPELTAWLPDLAEQIVWDITPGNKVAYQWGDDQDPRSLVLTSRIPFYAMVAGLTGHKGIHQAIADMTTGLKPDSYMYLGWRALYFYKLPLPDPAATFFRTSTGNGHFRYKRDSVLFAAHCPKILSVDHEVNYVSDFGLFIDSQPVLTRAIGYASPAMAGNVPLFAGLAHMSTRGPSSWKESPDGCEIVCGTSGNYYGSTYYQPPPTFLKSHTRTLTFTHPNKVTVRDSFDGVNPQTLPLFAHYQAADQTTIKAAPALWQQVFHCPVQPTETPTGYTWTAKGGKTVTLTAPLNALRIVYDEHTLPAYSASVFHPGEIAWEIRFVSDDPTIEMLTTLEVD